MLRRFKLFILGVRVRLALRAHLIAHPRALSEAWMREIFLTRRSIRLSMMADVQAGYFAAQLLFGTQPETPVASQQVNVYAVGTSTPVTLYTDATSGTTATNPVVTDALGNIEFFAAPGLVDIVYAYGDVTVRQTVNVAPVKAAISITTPAVVSGTAFQNLTGQDQTYFVVATAGSGAVATATLKIGPTSTPATTLGAPTIPESGVSFFTVVVPAEYWFEVTVAGAGSALTSVTAINRA